MGHQSSWQFLSGRSGGRHTDMAKTAYIFPGQGSQYVGMGKNLFEQSPVARQLYGRADELMGYSLSAICFEGPEERLKQTNVTQPAIFLHSVVLSRLLEHPDAAMAAGHSLGEYSALVYAGAMSFEDGLNLVKLRGELMQQAGERDRGTMAAVVGLQAGILTAICREAEAEGVVQCANFNSPGQIVISGSVAGVKKAMELAKARGAKLVKELVVSGAFHSPLMEGAREGLRTALETSTIRDAKVPVYANVSARPVQQAGEIRRLLEEQLTSPVRWEESVVRMIGDGAAAFVEIGPGKVLQNLVKRIDGSVNVSGIETIADARQTVPA
jgi:[acyl-carrier-protein] S-malonyltransferase